MMKLPLRLDLDGTGLELTRRALLATSVSSFALASSRTWSSEAPSWPSKPIRLIVPAPAGGVSDAVARLLSEPMSANLKQPVIVENLAGGSGVIGCRAVLNAPSDGHTMLAITSSVLTEVPHVVKVPYDPTKDFVQVAELVRMPLVLVGNTSLPAKNYEELVALLKSHPRQYSVASYSTGTRSHYAAVLFNQRAGVDLQHVPYKGSPPAVADLLAGHVPLAFEALPNVVRYIQSGKLRAYAILGPTRLDLLPGVPSFVEKGLPELTLAGWQGIWISSATPAALTQRIHAEVAKAFLASRAQQQLSGQGYEFSKPTSLLEQKHAFTELFERNAAIVQKYAIRAD